MAGPTQTVVSGTWPIYTTGGGPLYVDFYNGVAAISTSAGFWGFIALVAICGLAGALVYVAWSSKFKAAFQWLMWLVISYNFLFTVTTTVQIIDPVYPALPGALVANVPFGLAFLDSISTTSGKWFRQTYETVFSLPNDVTYGSHGMLFGASLMMASQQAQVPSSDFASNLTAYMQQCVMYDISTGVIPMDQLTAAADLWSFVTTTYPPNPGLSVDYTAGGSRTIISCTQMVTNLNQGWNTQLTSGQQTLAQRLFPQNDPVTANSLMLAALPATTQYLVGVSRTSSQILQQAMMMNMVDSSMRGAAAGSDATAALNAYTDATTSLTTLQSQQAAGRAATKWLPLMKIILELSYVALFMISFPLTMISVGQAKTIMIGYLSGFVTVAAFEPIFAFMHRIAMGNGAWDSAAAAVNADGTINITLATVTGIAGASADMAASGNYMLFAIPTIAAGILGGTQWAASAASTALYSPQRAAQQAGSQAASGNISVGNASFDNESIGNSSQFQVNHDPQFRSGSTRIEGAHGEINATHADGTRTVDASGTVSQLPVTLNARDQLGAEYTRRAAQEQSVGQQLSTEAANTHAASTSQALDYFDQRSKSGGWSSHDRETFGANNVSAMEKSSDLVNQFAKDHSISTREAAEFMQYAETGAKLPDVLPISAGIGGRVSHMSANDKNRLFKEAQDFTEKTGFRQTLDTAVSAVRDKADESSDSRVQQLGHRLTADEHQTQQLTQSAREHFDRSKQYSTAATETQSQGEEFNRNMNDQFIQYLSDRTNPHTGAAYGMEGATRMILSRDSADRAYVDVIGKDFIKDEASRRADALPQAQASANGTSR